MKSKIEHIKIIERGKWKLTHDSYTDDMGIRRDSFFMTYQLSAEDRVNFHFYPPFITISDEQINIFNHHPVYSDSQYEKMFKDEKDRMERRYHENFGILSDLQCNCDCHPKVSVGIAENHINRKFSALCCPACLENHKNESWYEKVKNF